MILQETTFLGQNTAVLDPIMLPPGAGQVSLNQKPGEVDFRPWRVPLALVGPVVPAGRQTLYRMGRATPDPLNFWLSYSGVVHIIRGFDQSDPTERTYLTDGTAPKWTDNILALAGTPYPTSHRLLAVPAPTIAPNVVLNADGPTGDARSLYYVYTWVNDIGWESAPSPPTLASPAKPGAIFDLEDNSIVPAGAYGINRIRWYRQQVAGDTGTAPYFFLREYAIGTSGMQDDARALGEELATETWIVLPNNATSLTQCWNGFAAAIVDKTVRFCEQNIIYAWPIEYEYKLNDQPLALASFAQRLVVLTDAGAEVLTGQEPGGMDQQPLKVPPIVSVRSLAVGRRFCMWATADGIHYLGEDARLGVGDRNLLADCIKPEQWAAFNPETVAGYLLELGDRTLYIGFYTDDAVARRGFVVDPLNPQGFYPLSQGYTSAYWDPLLRKLFVLEGSTLKQWDAGDTFMTGTWRGKRWRQVADTEAEWLELVCEGTTQTKLIVDGTTEMDVALDQDQHRVENGTEGREWECEFSTTTSVQGLVVE